MGDLGLFFKAVNVYRVTAGLPAVTSSGWFATRQAKEYIDLLKTRGIAEPVKLKKGRGRSYAHLKVLLRAAIDLSPELADEVIDLFITNRLPYLRDSGGDNYLEVRDALSMYGETVLGKPAHKGHMITLATVIRRRASLDKDIKWEQATPEQHSDRIRIEQFLVTMLRAGVVRDWDHLKDLAEIV
jgi:hypothetical protein